MDTTTLSLLLGSLTAGLIWWCTSRLVRSRSGAPSPDAGNGPADTAEVFRKLRNLRLTGGALCLLAAGTLYVWQATVPACVLACGGCWLQYLAYRLRSRQRRGIETDAAPPQ